MHTLTDSEFNSITVQDPEGSAEEILALLKWNFGMDLMKTEMMVISYLPNCQPVGQSL